MPWARTDVHEQRVKFVGACKLRPYDGLLAGE